jgi:hypothetical protein
MRATGGGGPTRVRPRLAGSNDSGVTGRFEGATGGLFFEGGVEPDGSFAERLTGTICLDK